jgi:predicted membrane chloride channel (bestrophin family)
MIGLYLLIFLSFQTIDSYIEGKWGQYIAEKRQLVRKRRILYKRLTNGKRKREKERERKRERKSLLFFKLR